MVAMDCRGARRRRVIFLVPARTRLWRIGECATGAKRYSLRRRRADLRDIQAYNKTDPSLKPLRKYTGHSSNVGVSTSVLFS